MNQNPNKPLQPPELETDVERTLKLLEEVDAGTKKLEKKVILRALVISAVQKVAPEPQPGVDAVLQQQSNGPGFQPSYPQPQQRHPFYGPPGKSRPPGVPDPGVWGPQSF